MPPYCQLLSSETKFCSFRHIASHTQLIKVISPLLYLFKSFC